MDTPPPPSWPQHAERIARLEVQIADLREGHQRIRRECAHAEGMADLDGRVDEMERVQKADHDVLTGLKSQLWLIGTVVAPLITAVVVFLASAAAEWFKRGGP